MWIVAVGVVIVLVFGVAALIHIASTAGSHRQATLGEDVHVSGTRDGHRKDAA